MAMPAGVMAPLEIDAGADIGVTTLKRASLSSESSVDEEPPSSSSSSAAGAAAANSNGNGGTVIRARGHDQLAAGLGEDLEAPDKETFNVIPGKEFGYAMLRMPWCGGVVLRDTAWQQCCSITCACTMSSSATASRPPPSCESFAWWYD